MPKASSQRDRAHARIYAEWLHLPAWRRMSPHARALLVETMTAYRPRTGNHFEWSERSAARALGCGRKSAAKALRQLVICGWFSLERAGRTNGPRDTRASVYSLTMFGTETDNTPSKEFLNWDFVVSKDTTNGLF